MNFSINTRSSPNEDFASERARVKPFPHLGLAVRHAHALAAAAGAGLDHHGIANFLGDLDRLRVVFDHSEMAGHGRDLGSSSSFL